MRLVISGMISLRIPLTPKVHLWRHMVLRSGYRKTAILIINTKRDGGNEKLMKSGTMRHRFVLTGSIDSEFLLPPSGGNEM